MIFRASECHHLVGRGRGSVSGLTLAGEKYVREKWLEHEKLFRPPVITKQTKKGIELEQAAIDLLNKRWKENSVKNEDSYAIEELQFSGTPDILEPGVVRDIKVPYTMRSFIHADLKKEYEWQLRAYMMLADRDRADLVYVLMDLPEHLWQDEWRRYTWSAGILDDADPEAVEAHDLLRAMYMPTENPTVSESERIKSYTIERDEEKENLLREGLRLALNYYESITLDMQL